MMRLQSQPPHHEKSKNTFTIFMNSPDGKSQKCSSISNYLPVTDLWFAATDKNVMSKNKLKLLGMKERTGKFCTLQLFDYLLQKHFQSLFNFDPALDSLI